MSEAWAEKHAHGNGWEITQVAEEVLRHTKGCEAILEIGTFQGDSLRVWREVFDPILLIGIQDTDETTAEVATELGATMIRGRSQDIETYRQVLGLMATAAEIPYAAFDFVYVDGDHTYEAALRDWQQYAPLVRPGGCIVLDDAVIEDNETVDIYRLYRELRVGRRSKLIYGGEHCTGAAVFYL